MLKDRMNYVKLADPMLRGKFPQSIFRRVVELVLMCVQDDPQARPHTKDIVLALSYFASQKHDSHATQSNQIVSQGDGRISPVEELTIGSPTDFNGAGIDVKEMSRDQERKRAVAEAKNWGETWREKGKQN